MDEFRRQIIKCWMERADERCKSPSPDFNECLKKRLIRKTVPSRGKARKSLEASSKWVEMLDHFREIRHTDQYSFNFFSSGDESEGTIKKSKEFVSRMKKLLDQISRK